MRKRIETILRPLSSVRLAVVLMALAIVLIFTGTLAQLDASAHEVQKQYFHSFWVAVPLSVFHLPLPLAIPLPGGRLLRLVLPLPGGYTIGGLLLVNVLAAHAVRFKFTRDRLGIFLIHAGLVLLLAGEGLSSILAVERHMWIEQGSSSCFAQDLNHTELAVIDPTPADHDNVTRVAGSRLAKGATIHDQRLPCDVTVNEYYPNSDVVEKRTGDGRKVSETVVPRPPVTGVRDADKIDMPSAQVTLSAGGRDLGTLWISTLEPARQVVIDGRPYEVTLRFARFYEPYTLHLLKFSHDRYTGTELDRNFASMVRLVDPSRHEDRQVKIWMNHPLRYHGETIYQAGFVPGDQATQLEIVTNPGWLLPYFACAIGALGLVVHFGRNLIGFLRQSGPSLRAAARRQRGAASGPAWVSRSILLPVLAVVGVAACVCWAARAPGSGGSLDLDAFGQLPISFDGRVQPLDSVARNSLRIVSGRDRVIGNGSPRPAIRWLADLMVQADATANDPVVRIDYPDILSMLNLDPSRNTFSIRELAPSERQIDGQFTMAEQTAPEARDLYQKRIVELGEKLQLIERLDDIDHLYLAAPLAADQQWQELAPAIEAEAKSKIAAPSANAAVEVLQAYRDNDGPRFNGAVAAYQHMLDEKLPGGMERLRFEAFFNRVDPFYLCMWLYVVVFVLAAMSWAFWAGPMARLAMWVLAATLLLHTGGLLSRIYIQGRPPVTNLYSSAIFIAWGAAVLSLGLEWLMGNGIGAAAAAMVAFPSLLIAHYLAISDGDTMHLLRAVLDTNIWLATHVVAVTLGYASTFLAGGLAIVYIFRGLISGSTTDPEARMLARVTYGIICFAMLFSFVGTILGGIWADQSWGRFWGWDPKENGAVIIVLWNALILHARWSGMVRQTGTMALAVFGNIVTAWSWFGTNMLGVGLHSYGFMDKAVPAMLLFVLANLAIIGPVVMFLSHVERRRAAAAAEKVLQVP